MVMPIEQLMALRKQIMKLSLRELIEINTVVNEQINEKELAGEEVNLNGH